MSAAQRIRAGRTALGIELGSTRIKACLVDAEHPATVLAAGSYSWQNDYIDEVWTYSFESIWAGLREAYASLVADTERRHGLRPDTFGSIGVSAMMHGYLAFDAAGELLVPFRTWRNTSTATAAAELSELFGVNIPLRWSIAHLHQAALDAESHVSSIASVTTLAGYVHRALTGRHMLGIGDASGMFPVDSASCGYRQDLVDLYDALPGTCEVAPLRELLPEALPAGADAGALTSEGAALLDPSGELNPGIPCCPPEGDAGTGMVATNAVAPRTGNVSVGTSVFAMVVLERPLARQRSELDLVATPAGDAVAMVHCNNGAGELAAWVGVFVRFAEASGHPQTSDEVYTTLLAEALAGEPDAGGMLVYNHLAGEPVVGTEAGRPLIVREPESRLDLANFARAQLYGIFGTLTLGMRVLEEENVRCEHIFAHGGMFRTAGTPQRILAAALDTPVAVGDTASEGGAWGIAVLAAFRLAGDAEDASAAASLSGYLDEVVFAEVQTSVADPDPDAAAGFTAYLERYRAGLHVEAAAVVAL